MEYFTVLTNTGIEKIAAATANNTTIDLSHIAVGDGNGTVPTPNIEQTQLINEVFRASLSELKIDENNSNHIVIRSMIPTEEGNFWIREVGIYDNEGDLIAVGNYPETYKSVLEEGAPKEVNLTVILEVSNTQVMNLVINPSVTLASHAYVDQELVNKVDKEYVDIELSKRSFVTGLKNKIINGNFEINQREFDGDIRGSSMRYTLDRWRARATLECISSTFTQEINNDTHGYFTYGRLHVVGTPSTCHVMQRIENVTTIQNDVTFSFWARADSNQTITIELDQYFGTDGSDTVENSQTFNITTSWEKYAFTLSNVSLNGKTIGAESYFQCNFNFTGLSDFVLDIAKVQMEDGDKATNFEHRPIGLEMSLASRYFLAMGPQGVSDGTAGNWTYKSRTVFYSIDMRRRPTHTFLGVTNTVSEDKILIHSHKKLFEITGQGFNAQYFYWTNLFLDAEIY